MNAAERYIDRVTGKVKSLTYWSFQEEFWRDDSHDADVDDDNEVTGGVVVLVMVLMTPTTMMMLVAVMTTITLMAMMMLMLMVMMLVMVVMMIYCGMIMSKFSHKLGSMKSSPISLSGGVTEGAQLTVVTPVSFVVEVKDRVMVIGEAINVNNGDDAPFDELRVQSMTTDEHHKRGMMTTAAQIIQIDAGLVSCPG